ncbi:hypothetical protein BDY19DRAFT_904256 [Irpex rosettiformis]|uniref:Uncharacterized protein n=1 Tax=Irpex rosettiformis TaxID=378272 RepID=A0ACB8UBL6_9APHY|nr:hypothetical protein BDY19DRAFT_904256 [Irpex rosettiformis]
MSDEIPQHLPRGKACVPCRKRKMKCDGNQPICNQCSRFNRAAECEFKEGPAPSTTRVLEQHIARLESRISELETDDPNAIHLHNPYSQSRAVASSAHASPAVQPAQLNWWDMPDPPTNIQQILIQSFLRHANKLGFFFESQRFLNSMTSPTGVRPPNVIRTIVYLWGITLSRNPQYTQHESKYLNRALRYLHVALSACSTPQYQGQQEGNVLDVLQASILLANYFFHHNRLLEGKFHTGAAVSLAHMCNLHKLLSPPGPAGSAAPEYLPRPLDVVQECERIHAWWSVFVLDKTWVVALSAPSMINEEQERGSEVDTPWPIGMDLYRQQPSSSRPNPGSTTKRFFAELLTDNTNVPNGDPSCLTLLAKASALYERANYIASYLDKNTPSYQAVISTFDASIERFKQSLPAIERSTQLSPDRAHTLLLIHTLTHSATIQLHWPLTSHSTASINRCLAAANTIVRVVQVLDVKRMEFANPVLGVRTIFLLSNLLGAAANCANLNPYATRFWPALQVTCLHKVSGPCGALVQDLPQLQLLLGRKDL